MPGEGLVGKVKLNLLQGDNLERENERGRQGGREGGRLLEVVGSVHMVVGL